MSYSVGVSGPHGEVLDKLEAQIGELNEGTAFDHTPGMKEAVADHLELGLKVARKIIESEDVVKEGQHAAISVSGHANPDHEPLGNWTHDSIYVSVVQLDPPKEKSDVPTE